MADNLIQGFQTDVGVRKYDYNALANKPTLITTSDLDKVIDTANDYTDKQIKKIDLSSINKIELDTSLSIQGKAADAKAVGEALESKLNKTELTSAIENALTQAKLSGEFNGEDGKDGENYVLTEVDKQEIAELASKLIEIPEIDSDNIDLSGYATEEWAEEKFVSKEEYLTNEDKENLTNEIIDKIFGDTLFIMNCGKADI